MMVLVNYFVAKTKVVAELHAFCKTAQMSNESFFQYVIALRELASMCDFGNHQDNIILA